MRLHSLQGLRALCISCVLLAHLSGTRHFVHSHVLEIYGNLGVRIFLVLSGYLITSQLIRQYDKTGTISLKMFYARRAFRIFPAAYIFMMVAIATHWSLLSWPNILSALTYTVNYCPRSHWVLGHLWSLAVEEQFYLLWPLCLLLFFRKRLWIVAGVIAAGPPMRILFWLLWGRPGLQHPFPVFMDALATGCALSILEPRLEVFQRIFTSRWFLLLTGLTALLPATQLWNSRLYQVFGLSALHIGIAFSLKHVKERRYWLLNCRPVMWFGGISYSLYLWQQLFLDRRSTTFWTAFPQNLVFAIVVAAASFYLVEQTSLNVRERWTRRVTTHLVRNGEPESGVVELAPSKTQEVAS